jgi:hypothetical protein
MRAHVFEDDAAFGAAQRAARAGYRCHRHVAPTTLNKICGS